MTLTELVEEILDQEVLDLIYAKCKAKHIDPETISISPDELLALVASFASEPRRMH